ncbi:MAG: FecR family protein [Ginsengibacter sp.]
MPDNKTPDSNLNSLLEKFFHNTCTREEFEELLELTGNEDLKAGLDISMKSFWTDPLFKNVTEDNKLDSKFFELMQEAKNLDPQIPTKSKVKWISKFISYAAAVVILGVLSIGMYYFFNKTGKNPTVKNIPAPIKDHQILPGGNKAFLTLSNGTIINLTDSQNGTLANQGNTKISNSNGMISYSITKNNPSTMLFNIISTPKGGQYKLLLADGTKVWLNAASSLRYPISFNGKKREVELTGEAYFEVAADKSKPFTVTSKNIEVQVLGTHFNINAYENEGLSRTTLLEGSVRINVSNNSQLLKPGQQARVSSSNEINVINNVETDEVIAWKNENFQFIKADIQSVMRQIERWYDVDVEYNGNISTHFGGSISRNVSLNQVLNILQQTQKVRFEMEGKKVIVSPFQSNAPLKDSK